MVVVYLEIYINSYVTTRDYNLVAFVMAAVLFLVLLPLIVEGQPNPSIFQLVTADAEEKCLQILNGGTFVPCKTNSTYTKIQYF